MNTMRKLFLLILSVCLATISYAKEADRIKGRVIDKTTKEALVGVAVVSQANTSVGTSTDVKGEFTLSVAPGTQLSVSYLGYVSRTVVAADGMTIELEPSSVSLDELVVVGYGTVRKSDLTGSVATVKGADLNILSTPNVGASLAGRTAGVQVVSSGSPDGQTKIRIRGIGTINNSDPLYVVDGYQTTDISYLAPSDIESMEIMKDASSSAIYGSRGSNGVILITTKKGADRPTSVSVNAYFGIRKSSRYLDVLNATDYAKARIEAYANDNATMNTNDLAMLNYVIDNNLGGTDWQKEVLRTATVQNYNIAVRGGSSKVRYNLSATYNSEEGVLKNSFVDKLFLKFNTEYQLHKSVTVGSDIAFVDYDMSGQDLSNMYGSALTLASRAAPVSPVYDQEGNWFRTMGQDNNPVRVIDQERYKKRHGNKFVGNFYLNVDILKGLSFRSTFSGDYTFTRNSDYVPEYYVSQQEKNDLSELSEFRQNSFNWVWSNVATYNFSLPRAHRLTAMLGVEATKDNYTSITATAYDVAENADMRYISAAKSNNYNADSDQGISTLFSQFARVNYSFKDRYLLTATLRHDASSRIPKDHRSDFFPSVSVGWNMAEESFLRDWKPLNQLKLRAGWGQVGNQASVGIGAYQAVIANNLKYVLGGQVYEGRIPTTLSNEDLRWETAEQFNVGVDAGFFDGKLTATLDYFVKDTKDMIITPPVPAYAGADPAPANVGSMRNSGFEFSLNHTNRIGEFSYNVGLNMSFIRNKVTSLGGSAPIVKTVYDSRLTGTSRTEEGREIAYYYGYRTDGIFHTAEELAAHVNKDGQPLQPNAKVGDVKYIDRDGSGQIDEGDLDYLGSYMPKFNGGLSLGAAYKGFFLSCFADFVYGNQIANMNLYDLYSTQMDKNILYKYYNDRWTEDTPYNNQPRLTTANMAENMRFSDRYIEDGSYFRIRNLQFGYDFPTKWIKRAKMSNLRVYLSIDNLYTFTKYTGYNPDVTDQWGDPLVAGSDVGGTPLPRTFTVGINLTF